MVRPFQNAMCLRYLRRTAIILKLVNAGRSLSREENHHAGGKYHPVCVTIFSIYLIIFR